MEDLGNINITIRDGAGGGGGGSGNVGGGPSALALRAMMIANQPIRIAQAAPQTAIAPFARLSRFQELQSELMGFAQRPTLGSALSLVRSNTATSQAIAGMGKAAMGVSTALVAVGAVGGLLAVQLAALQMASAHAASRIEEVWRFSSATTGAMAEQQVARFVNQINEAAANGAVYARAIRAQTETLNAYGKMQIELGKTTAELDIMFSRFKTSFFEFATGMLKFSEFMQTLAGYTPIGYAVEQIRGIDASNQRLGISWWQSFQVFITSMIGGKSAGRQLLLSYMAEIARNTDPNAGTDAANEWFQADIKAMTGLPY